MLEVPTLTSCSKRHRREGRPVGQRSEPQLLVLSARSNKALDAASKNLADHLRADRHQRLDDIAFTLMNGRETFEHRRAIVANERGFGR